MTPTQALQFLLKMLVTKDGLSVPQCAEVVLAWNVVAAAIKEEPKPEEG